MDIGATAKEHVSKRQGQQVSMFTVKVPVITNPRDERIIRQRVDAASRLKNAALGSVITSVEQMWRDKRYRAACSMEPGPARTAAFTKLKDEYRISQFGINMTIQEHWRSSKWMPTVIHSTVGQALSVQIWRQIEEWLFEGAGRPSFRPTPEAKTIWGLSTDMGLRWSDKHQAVVFPSPGRRQMPETKAAYPEFDYKRKNLVLQLKKQHAPGSKYWETRIGTRKIRQVGLTHEITNGGERWFALLVVEGTPYRNPALLRAAAQKQNTVAGIDLNVSNVAVVGDGTSEIYDLADSERLVEAEALAARTRRVQRALDRSIRASNPQAFDSKGRRVRGRRASKRSKRAERLQDQLRLLSRTEEIKKTEGELEIARKIATEHGAKVVYEDVATKQWRRWRKRMILTRPASQMRLIAQEANLLGGSQTRLPLDLALSQTCPGCGARAKKPLGQRTHSCAGCGLGMNEPLDRDLTSAVLARLVGEHGIETYRAAVSEGTLGQLSGGIELNVLLSRTPAPSPSPRKGKRETASCQKQPGTTQVVRALDGAATRASVEGAEHDGSRTATQTDRTRLQAVEVSCTGTESACREFGPASCIPHTPGVSGHHKTQSLK